MALRFTHSGTSHQALSHNQQIETVTDPGPVDTSGGWAGLGTGALTAILATGRVAHELLT